MQAQICFGRLLHQSQSPLEFLKMTSSSNMAASMEHVYSCIASKFSLQKLNTLQCEVSDLVLKNQDIFISTKTGSGKSLCYQSMPYLWEKMDIDKGIVLVVSPLVSVMKEQVGYLKSKGINATYIGNSKQDDELIKQGKMNIVYGSPEAIVGMNSWRSVWCSELYRKKTGYLVIDEAHTIVHWGQATTEGPAFRKWFDRIGEMRSLLPGVALMAITATASLNNRKKILKNLCMQNARLLLDSPDRDNVKLSVEQVKATTSLNELFSWLNLKLGSQGKHMERTVIFCKTISDVSSLYKFFTDSLPTEICDHVEMYHSMTPEDVKDMIRDQMDVASSKIRLLVATNAAGMGVNFAGTTKVIHYGPPQDLDTYVQQLGRAGRTQGTFGHSLILYHGRQMRNLDPEMLSFVRNADKCRRQLVCESYNQTKDNDNALAHECCDICAIDCQCGEPGCPDLHEAADALYPDTESEEESEDDGRFQRYVTPEDQRILAVALEQFLDNMKDSAGAFDINHLHGVNEDVVASIVVQCPKIFTADDLLLLCPVSSYSLAAELLLVINSVLGLESDEIVDEGELYLGMDD